MFDISELSVMTREHSFNIIHQILNCFTNCFYLLFSFCLYCSLCRYLLGQLLVSWVKPFRAANRMFKTSALIKITETFLYPYPEIKFSCCVDGTAKCLTDSIKSSSEGIHSTESDDKTENSLMVHVLLSLCLPLSAAGEAPGQTRSCWTGKRRSTSADSVWAVQTVQHQGSGLLLFSYVNFQNEWYYCKGKWPENQSKSEKNYSTSTVYYPNNIFFHVLWSEDFKHIETALVQ